MPSGTPEQFVNFIRTLEDGMYSRFMFYTMSPTYKWKNQSSLEGNGNINARELFVSVGKKMKANFFKTKDKEVMINSPTSGRTDTPRYSSANWDMLQLRKIPTSWL